MSACAWWYEIKCHHKDFFNAIIYMHIHRSLYGTVCGFRVVNYDIIICWWLLGNQNFEDPYLEARVVEVIIR